MNLSLTNKVKRMKAKAAEEHCNITEVVQDFNRAWEVCYYLFKIAPNAGSFENPRYLEQYFPNLDSLVLSGANLNNAAKKLCGRKAPGGASF